MPKNRERKEYDIVKTHAFLREMGGKLFVLSMSDVPEIYQTMFRGKVMMSGGQMLVVKKSYLPKELQAFVDGSTALAFSAHENSDDFMQTVANGGMKVLGALIDGQVLSAEQAESILPEPAAPEQADEDDTAGNVEITLEKVTNKLGTIKVLRSLLGLTLIEAKKVVDSVPATIAESVTEHEGDRLVTKLLASGATVGIRKAS